MDFTFKELTVILKHVNLIKWCFTFCNESGECWLMFFYHPFQFFFICSKCLVIFSCLIYKEVCKILSQSNSIPAVPCVLFRVPFKCCFLRMPLQAIKWVFPAWNSRKIHTYYIIHYKIHKTSYFIDLYYFRRLLIDSDLRCITISQSISQSMIITCHGIIATITIKIINNQ